MPKIHERKPTPFTARKTPVSLPGSHTLAETGYVGQEPQFREVRYVCRKRSELLTCLNDEVWSSKGPWSISISAISDCMSYVAHVLPSDHSFMGDSAPKPPGPLRADHLLAMSKLTLTTHLQRELAKVAFNGSLCYFSIKENKRRRHSFA